MYSEGNNSYSAVSENVGLLKYLLGYITLRSRQVSTILLLFLGLFVNLTGETKNYIVRNMYWGRTSFYKTVFHIVIILVTTSALYTGLGSRLISTQVNAERYKNLTITESTRIDDDIIYQQGALFPVEELDESDDVYVDYTVKQGDSLNKIASENSINADTLRWANNIPAGRDTLKVGQVIKIPIMNGVLYTVKEGDTVEKILSKVEGESIDKLSFQQINYHAFTKEDKLRVNAVVLVPDASLPLPRTVRTPTRGPINVVNPPPPTGVPTGTFVNPMQKCNYYLSRGYSYSHTGVDLPSNSGCWVVAAGGGVVTQAGWCLSIGYCVVIKHSNGWQTLYGHSNGVFGVRAGQTVVSGQNIMQVGCTGRCSAPHLHLSITVGGQDVFGCYRCRVNPRPYIPY